VHGAYVAAKEIFIEKNEEAERTAVECGKISALKFQKKGGGE
jgi:hypothetical protein